MRDLTQHLTTRADDSHAAPCKLSEEKSVSKSVNLHLSLGKVPRVFPSHDNIAEKLTRLEEMKIPDNFDFYKVHSLSIEAKQKLTAIRPVTISQASRISGVSPADISILLIYMGR